MRLSYLSRRAPSLLGLCIVASNVQAQPAASSAASASIGPDDPRIDSVFAFVKPGAPGCAVGIYRNGELAWARGYGLASVELQVPITHRTVFDLGSTSKQFTAALTLLLVAEGAVQLDAPVRRYIPELPAWGDTTTVRQLLHHIAGVRDYLTLFVLGGIMTEDLTTQAEAVRAVARQRALDFPPGSAFSYSNSGYLLLAEIVARRSGKSFAQNARERIFTPLGMTHTMMLDNHATVVPNKAGSYVVMPNGTVVTEVSSFEQVGDGGVQTSLEDLAKWIKNFESPTVGGAALIRELETTGVAHGKPISYARGLMVDSVRGLRRVRHGGAWAGFRADLARIPDKRLAVATLCNRGDATTGMLVDRVMAVVLDGAGVPRPATNATASASRGASSTTPATVPNAARYAGFYFAAKTGRGVRLQTRNDSLSIGLGSGPLFLRQVTDGAFVVELAPEPTTIRFTSAPSRADSIVGFEMRMGGAPDTFERFDPSRPADESVRRSLAGAWYSEELDVTWRFSVDSSGRISAHLPRRPAAPVQPLVTNSLRAGPYLLTLERDAGGTVTAFTVGAGRARGMRFVRAR
jgi:CubicO group peptidase (beta-lactamase class C family)